MFGVGGMVSQGGRSLIRLATTGLILAGVGTAGLGVYGNQLPPEAQGAQAFIQDNAKAIIIVGVALVVLGGILNFVMAQRMQKRMMGSMMGGAGGMGGMGMSGMPDMQALQRMQGMAGLPGVEVVKVRCNACGKLQLEAARFCADCGKAMMPIPANP